MAWVDLLGTFFINFVKEKCFFSYIIKWGFGLGDPVCIWWSDQAAVAMIPVSDGITDR